MDQTSEAQAPFLKRSRESFRSVVTAALESARAASAQAYVNFCATAPRHLAGHVCDSPGWAEVIVERPSRRLRAVLVAIVDPHYVRRGTVTLMFRDHIPDVDFQSSSAHLASCVAAGSVLEAAIGGDGSFKERVRFYD